jgi:hypothetical protein
MLGIRMFRNLHEAQVAVAASGDQQREAGTNTVMPAQPCGPIAALPGGSETMLFSQRYFRALDQKTLEVEVSDAAR